MTDDTATINETAQEQPQTDEQPDDDVSYSMVGESVEEPHSASDEDLENQEWTLGQQKVEIIEKLGMKWKLVEPEDDETIAELIETLQINQGSMDALRQWAEVFIEQPEITEERWKTQMTPRERYLMGDMVLDFFGVEDFMDEGDIERAIAERREAAQDPAR